MTKPTTNNFGIAVASDDESLTAGIQGPVLLHDHYLIEKLAQFNRERVRSASSTPRAAALSVNSSSHTTSASTPRPRSCSR